MKIKYEFIPGLEDIVSKEITTTLGVPTSKKSKGILITEFVENPNALKNLKSVNNVYYLITDHAYNPKYLSKNIEILFQLIDKVIVNGKFGSFNIDCAGDKTKEILSIIHQIEHRYRMPHKAEADLQINYGKHDNEWEIAIRLTNRPLSLRDWREVNIPGGLNPTIAYAMNVLTQPKSRDTYLNIFSGSGTLLIERANWEAQSWLGIDINGLYNSYAIKNIKKASLLKRIKIRKYDINELPDLGKFDVITANLPFGIQQSKGENIEELYRNFIITSKKSLNKGGRLVAYTIHDELLGKYANEFGIGLDGKLSLEVQTSINTKIFPKILFKV